MGTIPTPPRVSYRAEGESDWRTVAITGIDPAQYGTVDTTAVSRFVSGMRQGTATFRHRKPGKRYDVSAKSLMRWQLRRMGHGR